MENSPSENNKRIAKNVLLLYFRSILRLGVGLALGFAPIDKLKFYSGKLCRITPGFSAN